MAGPEWIDEALSRELHLLRDWGEGQHLEFMERYPENGHELSREIAAFASSNAGTVLIGVADDGSLAGLDNVDISERLLSQQPQVWAAALPIAFIAARYDRSLSVTMEPGRP